MVHRDIKLENILLKQKTNEPQSACDFEFKIADMGLAKHNFEMTIRQTICGTPMYMPPELLREEPYNAKADVWSVGILAFYLVAARFPFDVQTKAELLVRASKQ